METSQNVNAAQSSRAYMPKWRNRKALWASLAIIIVIAAFVVVLLVAILPAQKDEETKDYIKKEYGESVGYTHISATVYLFEICLMYPVPVEKITDTVNGIDYDYDGFSNLDFTSKPMDVKLTALNESGNVIYTENIHGLMTINGNEEPDYNAYRNAEMLCVCNANIDISFHDTAQLDSVRSLHLYAFWEEDSNGIEGMKRLERIALRECEGYIGTLTQLPSLKALLLVNSRINDMHKLSDMDSLEALTYAMGEPLDADHLVGMDSLLVLEVWGEIENPDALLQLSGLRVFRYAPMLKDDELEDVISQLEQRGVEVDIYGV